MEINAHGHIECVFASAYSGMRTRSYNGPAGGDDREACVNGGAGSSVGCATLTLITDATDSRKRDRLGCLF